MQEFTGWMNEPVTLYELVIGWLGHVNRLFIDIPGVERFWIIGAILLFSISVGFFRYAPHKFRLFAGSFIIVALLIVVLPDLLLARRGSLEARYLLILFLALDLMVAWTVMRGMDNHNSTMRKASYLVFVLLLGSGLVSQYLASRSDSWWIKSFSAENAEFARLVNASDKPLVIGSYSYVSTGEILSLAHLLDEHVRVLIEKQHHPAVVPSGYTRIFLFMPSDHLRLQLEHSYLLEPFHGSWKWYVASLQNASPKI